MELVNMKMEDNEEYAETALMGPEDVPTYPYCLKITLQDEQLQKLGLEEMPEVGSEVKILAIAKVTDLSETEVQDEGTEKRMGLQITDMAVEGMPNLDSIAEKLYGGGE